MKVTQFIRALSEGTFNTVLQKLYGSERLSAQRERYTRLATGFHALYGDREVSFFSVPGRTEISGNHTDHNNGKVLAASVDIDIIAVASPSDDYAVHIKSDGYREDVVPLDNPSPEKVRKGSSSAIIAGIADSFAKSGRKTGGFCAYTTSDVLTGSGLSSSAAFEVMVGCIFSHFFNDGTVPPLELAKAGKYAENVFFGKPCGLMDQAACALGGFAYIDFSSGDTPFVEKLDFDLTRHGYSLCIVNTGGNHADLTGDYASVPAEMKQIAAHFGKPVLRFVAKSDFLSEIPALRKECGDRAVLRALHYFNENDRVENQRKALKDGDLAAFLAGVTASGDSSFKYLQNVYTTQNTAEQGLSLALALCDNAGVVSRVHGGGFAGTVQAFVPNGKILTLRTQLEAVFGQGNAMILAIRPYGAVRFDEGKIYE